MVPGLFIRQHAGGGKAEQIFLRGFDIDHGTDIRLMVDGMPVNMVSHAHGQGYADLHFVIPELVENVDFKKGTYHTDKGNFSTAGWVNFHTKDVLENSMAKVEAGQFNTFRGLAMVNLLPEKARQKEPRALGGLYRNGVQLLG
jgi:outer membrane cobalamin receptor